MPSHRAALRPTTPRAAPVTALLVAVLVAACSTAASIPPATTHPNPTGAAGSPGAVASGVPSGSLADALRAGTSVDDIADDLAQLQAIADANGGTRAAGTPGYDASADFVATELEAAGFTVQRQPVTITAFSQTAPSILEIPGGPAFGDIHDFKAMTFSASGDVTARVVALGWDAGAQPGDRNGLGCNPGDWTGFPSGAIALVQPGPCRRRDAVTNAEAAGAVAVVTTYASWPRDAILRPTLITPDGITVPVIGATHAVGEALNQAAANGALVHLSTSTSAREVQSANVIGESTWGDPAHVLMLGGHLDSVIDGPGINDNGSGTMTVLEIARSMAELVASRPGDAQPKWKLRVAFWTGEEIALLGSAAYADTLTAGDLEATEAYLNFDMIGSPNGVRVVYQETDPQRPAEEATITALFGAALDSEALAWEPEAIGGASDHYPLEQAGIPIGGLFSGANEVMTADEALKFDGNANAPDDPCYHLACDTMANVDGDLLRELARATAYVTGQLLSGEVALRGS